jgi:hypothetical protein
MKRFILCTLLLQTTFVLPDSQTEPFSIPFQNIAAFSAVLAIPYAFSQIHAWWNNYSLNRLDDIALLREVQKRLFVLQEPFHNVTELLKKYPLDSIDNYFALKHEIHECVLQFQNASTYKYSTYVNNVETCIHNLKQLQSAVQKRIEKIDCTTTTLCDSYAQVYSNINTVLAMFSNLHNYLKNTSEYAQDSFNSLNHVEDYSPAYLVETL